MSRADISRQFLDKLANLERWLEESRIDLRPDAEYSYLTHREVRLPVRTELFSPCKARLLGPLWVRKRVAGVGFEPT